jgi:allantoinase
MLRDFVGYGANPPHPQWPGYARIAVNFVLNVEEGSEPSIGDGDGYTESGLTEVTSSPVPRGMRDLGAESMFEFGARVGFWRLHRMFTELNIPLTAFVCPVALENNDAISAALRATDWDFCAHGLRWIEHYNLTEAEEKTQIAQAASRIESVLGRKAQGWYCRYAPSVHTRRLVVEHGGFEYDSDSYNDELPYWTDVGQQAHLVIPYSLTHNDTRFVRGAISTGHDFFDYLKESFDFLYAEGAEHPKMMSIGLHSRIVGHPGRASGVRRFLEYIASKERVWLARRCDIAAHWRQHFSPE